MSAFKLGVVLLSASFLAGCIDSGGTDSDVREGRAALTPVQSRVLGFEAAPTDWSTNSGPVIQSSTDHSQGAAALRVAATGYLQLTSVNVAAPGASRSTATFDLKLPSTPSWGDARLVMRAPSQGHYWRDLGGVSLAGKAAGTFHTLSFTVPTDVRSALDSAATDVSFVIVLNTQAGAGNLVVDNLVVSDNVAPTPAPAPGSISLSLSVPLGVGVAQVMMSGDSQLTIDDQVTLGQPGQLSNVASVGPQPSEFGAQVKVHANVLSVANVDFLRSQSTVFGDVITGGTIQRQDNVTIVGQAIQGGLVTSAATTWQVPWPAEATTDISRAPDAPDLPLPPGGYDAIQIFSRATVTLRSGSYFINSLVVEPEAHLRVDTSGGPVLIYVKDTLRLNVGLEYQAGPRGQVLFGYVGQQAPLFQEAIVASVVAPNSTIELRRPNSNLPHEGSFFGKAVHVFAGATVRHLPLDWAFICDRGDQDKDGVFDCFEICTKNKLKTMPGLCGCSVAETDTDLDQTPDCLDRCPNDPDKLRPGYCGCADAPAPAGTACADGLLCTAAVCDGAGFCGSPEAGEPAQNGCVAREFGTRLYWFCSGGATWPDARAACAAQPGRSLVEVDTAEESAFLNAFTAGADVWTGANDLTAEGTYRWSVGTSPDGSAFWSSGARANAAFSAWASTGTAGGEGEDCVAAGSGTWSDADCSAAKAFVCESRNTDGCVPPLPKTTCGEFFPGRDCTAGLPGDDDGECEETADLGNWTEFQAKIDACFDGCDADDAECVEACADVLDVPASGDRCTSDPDDGHERACEMAYSTRSCKSDADCTDSANPLCVRKFQAGCYACQQQDADDNCIKPCASSLVCGHPTTDCDSEEPARCGETSLCGGASEGPDYSDPRLGPGADLTQTDYHPEDDFPPPTTRVDVDYPLDPACDSSPCGIQGENHAWCKVDMVADAQVPGGGSENEMGTRGVDEVKKGRSGRGSLVSFDFDPNLVLDYSATPGPFGTLGNLHVLAEASFLAKTEFSLGDANAKLNLIDAKASLVAERCKVSTEDTRFVVMNQDVLPKLLDGKAEETLLFTKPSAEATKSCEDAFDTFEQAVNRTKKALRDAEDMIAQYKELVAYNVDAAQNAGTKLRTFPADFCEKVVQSPPRGFPAIDCSTKPSPERVIGAFIQYYETYVLDQLEARFNDMVGASFDLHESVGLFNVRKDITQRVVQAQFAIGPIPCVLEIDVFAHYGLSGSLEYSLTPGNLLLLDDGAAKSLAWVRVVATPSAGAGLSLFVGAGGGVPGFSASVGIYGDINLATIDLPMSAGAGIKVASSPDPRIVPDGVATLYPKGGPRQYTFKAGYELSADAIITNILGANLGVRIKIEFLFFSWKFKQAILTLAGFNAPPISLLKAGGDISATIDTPDWAVIRMPLLFPDLPDLPSGGLPLPNVDGEDAVEELAYSTGNTEQLFFDSLCTCAKLDESCFRHDDCCGGGKEGTSIVCFAEPSLQVPGQEPDKICTDCRKETETCGDVGDCCDSAISLCDKTPYEEIIGYQPCPEDEEDEEDDAGDGDLDLDLCEPPGIPITRLVTPIYNVCRRKPEAPPT